MLLGVWVRVGFSIQTYKLFSYESGSARALLKSPLTFPTKSTVSKETLTSTGDLVAVQAIQNSFF